MQNVRLGVHVQNNENCTAHVLCLNCSSLCSIACNVIISGCWFQIDINLYGRQAVAPSDEILHTYDDVMHSLCYVYGDTIQPDHACTCMAPQVNVKSVQNSYRIRSHVHACTCRLHTDVSGFQLISSVTCREHLPPCSVQSAAFPFSRMSTCKG